MKIALPVATLLALASLPVSAQTYVPIGTDEPSTTSPLLASADLITHSLGMHSMAADIKGMDNSPALQQPARFPECTPAPKLADIEGVYQMRRTLLTSTAALKMGIPVASATVGGSQMVLVQDYSRTRECLATDNKTRLVYGQAIRTIVSLSSMDAKADVTLPVVAANSTLSGKRSAVEIQVFGIENPAIPALLAKAAGKELNVESYGDIAAIQGDLMKLADAAGTKKSIKRLGVIAETDERFQTHVAAVYALKQIKAGKSCTDAVAKYGQTTGASTVQETYEIAMGSCSGSVPSKEHKELAGRYLEVL